MYTMYKQEVSIRKTIIPRATRAPKSTVLSDSDKLVHAHGAKTKSLTNKLNLEHEN